MNEYIKIQSCIDQTIVTNIQENGSNRTLRALDNKDIQSPTLKKVDSSRYEEFKLINGNMLKQSNTQKTVKIETERKETDKQNQVTYRNHQLSI